MRSETQPPLSDLEIAATWDEIELEAVLRDRSIGAAPSYAIPKFLAMECPSRDPEHPDSLIPLRVAATASAVIGAMLLIYFRSSPEAGVAAVPIAGASEVAEVPAAPPEIPSVAVRQALVAEPLAYSAASEPVRSYHPPFVGFDLGDAVPPPVAARAGSGPIPPLSILR